MNMVSEFIRDLDPALTLICAIMGHRNFGTDLHIPLSELFVPEFVGYDAIDIQKYIDHHGLYIMVGILLRGAEHIYDHVHTRYDTVFIRVRYLNDR